MLLICPSEPWSLCTNGIYLQYYFYFYVILYIGFYLQYKAEADRKDFCFICNIPAHEFDRKSEVSAYWYIKMNDLYGQILLVVHSYFAYLSNAYKWTLYRMW